MSPPLAHLSNGFEIARATASDVPAIVALLADDPLGSTREGPPTDAAYQLAFGAIDRDPNQLLVVVRCAQLAQPEQLEQPTQPEQHEQHEQPEQPEPEQPDQPQQPGQPGQPGQSQQSQQSQQPQQPEQPEQPQPQQPEQPEQPQPQHPEHQRLAGTLQLTFVPGLARRGTLRALIEAVRIDTAHRGQGLGGELFTWAIEYARGRGAGLVQLSTDKTRARAHEFYKGLGFEASHEGMKLQL